MKKNILLSRWLLICCLSIVVMVSIGGLTRLTGSGLSMVDWKPITGWLPPISEKSWQDEFNLYKKSPQYKEVNFSMKLSGFKKIYSLEYFHRIFGRFIGLLFFLPLVFFWIKGYLLKAQKIKYVCFLFLGGLQGFVGWFMVKSGLVDVPKVSHYRLTLHLSLALLCFSLILMEYFKLKNIKSISQKNKHYYMTLFFLIVVIIQIILGGFTAGLEAGRGFNTFPLMNGEFIPFKLLEQNASLFFLDNSILVQFMHRLGGFLLIVVAFFYVKSFWKCQELKKYLIALVIILITQFSLGVLTLLSYTNQKPIALALTHQFFAMILLTISLFFFYKNCRNNV